MSPLAEAFRGVVREWLSSAELRLVDERNQAYPPDVCATHDFCDSNMAMFEAFVRVHGREPDGDQDDAAWNAAWTEARAGRFA